VRRTNRLRQVVIWLALGGAILAAVLFLWIRATTPSDGARVAFYGDAWSAAGVRIDPIDQPAAGLAPGDLVVAVDHRSMESWLGQVLDASTSRPSATAPIPYDVIRDGRPVAISVTWVVPAVGATLLAGWSVILFSIAVAAVAAFVFARRPDEPAATALVVAACGVAGSSVPWFLGTTVSDVVVGAPFVLHSIITGPLYMILWPAGVHLALVFPTRKPIVIRHRWLIPGVYAVALGAYGLAMLTGRLTTASDLEWVGTWPLAQVAVVVPALALTLALFIRTYRRTTDSLGRTRIRWAWLGVVASGTIGLALYMVPELLVQRTILPASWIGLTAMPLPLGLAAGILRDRLFDIDVVIRRTFVYGGLTLGVIASYVLMASALTAIIGTDHGFGVSLLATGAAALVALPLRDGLQRTVGRLLYGERDEPWRAIRRLGQRLDLAVDPDRAFPAIVDTVADALRVPYVGLEVVDDAGRSPIVAERGATPGTAVTVPLVHGTERVGSLILGVRYGEHEFRSDEMALLEDLARQAGATVHALRLRAALSRSHERLLLAREEERRRLRHDLHDGLGPSLAAIGLRAEASAQLLDSDPVEAKRLLDEMGTDVQTALADIRRLVDGLRPPALDELGLVGAIRQQVERLEDSAGVGPPTRITVEGFPEPLPDLPAAVEVAAYRIAIEAVTNAVRHAGARTCQVRLEAIDQLVVEVVDDGRGLATEVTPGTGLESMRSRATEVGGSLVIESRRSDGTRLRARLPLGGQPASFLFAPNSATGAGGS
jgi:two-component system NarL family sensor kinase